MIYSKDQIDKHLMASERKQKKIADVCAPLFRFSYFNYFGFNRLYKAEKKWIGIYSDPHRVRSMMSYDLLPPFFDDKGNVCVPSGYYYDDQLKAALANHFGKAMPEWFFDTKYTIAVKDFNVSSGNGFYIFCNGRIYDDIFFFSASVSGDELRLHVNDFIDVLKNFSSCFLFEASKLLQQCHKIEVVPYQNVLTAEKDPMDFRVYRDHLMSSYTQTKFVFEGSSDDVLLSRQEKKCIDFLYQCESYLEIAQKMGLSLRTVESYIDSIKNKLGATSKKQILDMGKKYQQIYR